MIHWTTVMLLCFVSGPADFFVAAALSMASDERKNKP